MAATDAATDGVEWALWCEKDELPSRVIFVRERLDPTCEDIDFVLGLLGAWLVEGASADVVKVLAANRVGVADPN